MRTIAFILGIVALIAVIVIIFTVVIALVWNWVVPDVFAGAVEQSILPAELTLVQAFKLAVLLAGLGLTGRASSSKE